MCRMTRLVCIVAVAAMAGLAYGRAERISVFNICAPATSAETDAMAILNYAQGTDSTTVQLIVSGLGFGTYQVSFESEALGGTSIPVLFEVDPHGVATLHLTMDGDWSDANIYITGAGTTSFILFAFGPNANNSLGCTHQDCISCEGIQ